MRIVMLCDWLPPDFGAVGQYAVGFANDLAKQGNHVCLLGFSSLQNSEHSIVVGKGSLRTVRIFRSQYNRRNFLRRAWWTLGANLALLWKAKREIWNADEIRFTGSPPYLIHFAVPLSVLLRKKTRYRITDFHPECLIAALDRVPLGLRILRKLTWFWRRRVNCFEALGEDQKTRLIEGGIDPTRIELLRDPSPVTLSGKELPAKLPSALIDHKIILYSGNWGVAHDHQTFVEGFKLYATATKDLLGLWLNATGGRVDLVKSELTKMQLPFAHTAPCPLSELPSVLLAADIHLITLAPSFVGYVLPSKVYACIASGRPILFIGSEKSDVHLLCSQGLPIEKYQRVDVGDAQEAARAIELLLNPALGRLTANQGDSELA